MNIFVFASIGVFLYIVILYVFGSKSTLMNKFSERIWVGVWMAGWWLIPGVFLILELYDMIKSEYTIVSIGVLTVMYILFAFSFFHKYFPKKDKDRKKAMKEWNKKNKDW